MDSTKAYLFADGNNSVMTEKLIMEVVIEDMGHTGEMKEGEVNFVARV